MKYRVTSVLALCGMLFLLLVFIVLSGEETHNRVHQHLTARQPDSGCDCDGSELCTHLPLVIIDARGQEIPGAVTGQRDAFGESINSLAADGRDVINVSLSVIDNSDRNNHPSDQAALVTETEIRIRGHASRYFEKSLTS